MAGFTDRFSVRVKNEFKKIRELKGIKAKLSYIWDYYKIPILTVIIVTIASVFFIRSLQRTNYDAALYVTYVNCISGDYAEDTGVLDSKLRKWLDIDDEHKEISIDHYNFNPDIYSEEYYFSSQKLLINIYSKSSDCYLGDELFTRTWSGMGNLAILEDTLPEELFAMVSSRLIYYTDSETGEEHAYGVDISGLPLTQELVFNIDCPVFSIAVNAPHMDACITFLEHITGYVNE